MITLRQIEESDLEMMKNWRNSEHVRPYVREYRFLSYQDQLEWFDQYRKQRRSSDWDTELMMIILSRHPVGIGGFTRIEWRNRKAELSFYVGNMDYFGMEQIPDVLRCILDIGFKHYGFHKVTWPVYSHDPRMPIYQKVFETEAILKEEYFWDGRFHDRIYLSLTKAQFDDKYKS